MCNFAADNRITNCFTKPKQYEEKGLREAGDAGRKASIHADDAVGKQAERWQKRNNECNL